MRRRTAIDWPWSVWPARSRLSIGLQTLGATKNDTPPDGSFISWLGQFQWVRRFPALLDTQLIVRTDLQIAQQLLALEQFAVGGRYTVRGYRENTLLRDNAFVGSVEARVPLVRNHRWADYLELAPFYDYGRSWNTTIPTGEPIDLSSIGIGLRWGMTFPGRVPVQPQLEIYWGHPFRNIRTSGGNLQDQGIHLQFILGFF